MQTIPNRPTALAPSPVAVALDALAAWLRAWVAYMLPEGPASQSALATAIGELRRHLDERHRDRALADLLEGIRRAVLASDPNPHELAELRRKIEARIDKLEHPPALPAPPRPWLELARDLGVTLAADRDGARPQLSKAIREVDTGDRRARPLMDRFMRGLGLGDPVFATKATDAQLSQWRHALVGYGLPPVRDDDEVFGRPSKETISPAVSAFREPPGHKFFANGGTTTSGDTLKRIAKSLGHSLPFGETQPEDEAERARIRDFEEAKRKELFRAFDGKRGAMTPNGDSYDLAYEKAKRELQAEVTRRRKAVSDRITGRGIEALAQLVAAIDRDLARLAKSAPGSLAYYWLRELRRHVADDPADRPHIGFGGVAHKPDLEHVAELCRSLNVPRGAS